MKNNLEKELEKEIKKKIKKLSEESNNFTYDNYGCEGADNGVYEVNYSESRTAETLKKFAEWLLVLTK